MTAFLDFIIPARNAEATIADTLRSLLAQTAPAWRAIVVDDGSTDATIAAARAAAGIDARIRIVGQPSAGVAEARNRGFALAAADQAPLLCFLDADDVVAPAFAERMASAIGDAELVACACTHAGPGLEPAGWTAAPGPDDHRLERLAESNPFCMGAVVFRRTALERLSANGTLFRGVTRLEDWELYLDLTASGARWAPVVAEALFTYRLRPGSRGSDLRTIWLDGLAIIDRHHPDRVGVAPAQRRWSLRSLARAAAAGESLIAAEIRSWLTGLQAADEGLLAGALRSAIRREAISTGRASAPDLAAITDLLGGGPIAAQAAARALHGGEYWNLIARAAAARLGPRTLVLYGLGRNGQELAAHLDALGTPFHWIDDRPPVQVDPRRLRVSDLGPQHAVLITPDERAGLPGRVAATGAEVWLPESLAMPLNKGCAA